MCWTRSLNPGVDGAMAEGWLCVAAVSGVPALLLWRGFGHGRRLRLAPPGEGPGFDCRMPAREPGDAGEWDAERIG
jgi:hypothetical protein